MIVKNKLWISFLFMIFLITCGQVSEDDTEPSTSGLLLTGQKTIPNLKPFDVPSVLKCDEGTNLTYGNFGKSFMATYCQSCHGKNIKEDERTGALSAVYFDSADDILRFRTKILQVAANPNNNKMPPSDYVSQKDRDSLREWLECGAPLGGDMF